MSDFTNNIVPFLIAAVTLIGLIGCGLLAWIYRSGGADSEQPATAKAANPGETPEPEPTGHVWDGDLYELNNPPPRWWLWFFYGTVVFSLIYLALYPGLGTFEGLLGWSQHKQYQEQRAELDARTEAAYSEFAGLSVEELATNDRAMSMANSLFLNNCAQCHGSDAGGSRGYPRLTDQDWQWGGDVGSIRTTIAQGRHGIMPPQAAAVGNSEAIRNVAAYVLSLSGAPTDAAAAARGRPIFANVCAACHAADGTGNPALGAPNLTDRIWVYGGSQADIIDAITNGRQGVMPAHENRLSEQQIDLLVAYVLNISGSVPAK